jgi:predicted nucleic-acid-binding protein
LTRQPKAQFEAARALFRKGGLFVSTPVVMEVYFTLTGSVLAFSDAHALEALDAVLHLPGVQVQHADEMFAAIAYARQGVPFKDACVLAYSAGATRLLTFDKPFAKRAAKLNLKPKVQAP